MPCFRRPLEVEMSFLALITSPFSQSQQTPPPLQRNADSSPPAQPCGQLCRDEFSVSPQKQSHLARSASGKISSRLLSQLILLILSVGIGKSVDTGGFGTRFACESATSLFPCNVLQHNLFKISQDYQQLLGISNNLTFKYFICFN